MKIPKYIEAKLILMSDKIQDAIKLREDVFDYMDSHNIEEPNSSSLYSRTSFMQITDPISYANGLLEYIKSNGKDPNQDYIDLLNNRTQL